MQVLRAHSASCVRGVLSVRSGGPRLAPFVEIGASPCHRTRPEAHWARELVLRDQPVDGRPPESGYAHDSGHPQEERRHHLSAAGRWYGRIALHELSPERGISATLGCKWDWRLAGFGPKSCVVVHARLARVNHWPPWSLAWPFSQERGTPWSDWRAPCRFRRSQAALPRLPALRLARQSSRADRRFPRHCPACG